MLPFITTLDFETEGIVGNPLLRPPKPVGLAVRYNNGEKEYVTEWQEMQTVFSKAVMAGPVLFHNASFDISVAKHWLFDELELPWDQVHDTIYLLYLADPYAQTFSLKPSAERYLDIPPTEQDACRDWILRNVPKATNKNWGAFLCHVPVEILGPYAKQDVEDTYLLFEKLWNPVQDGAYNRERQLAPILVRATQVGVRVATGQLEQALEVYTGQFEQADHLLRTYLQAPGLNPSSSAQLAQALDDAGQVEQWHYTEKGARSCEMKKLKVKDPELQALLKHRSTLKTLLGTFIKPWLELEENGRLHPNWNSTRGDRAGGTRTGRLSSSAPNFQNVPNPADIPPVPGLLPLPHMRDFILPEEGHLWLKRDFSAQEIRIMAHYEDGSLAQAFRENPDLDPHTSIQAEIAQVTGVEYPRKYVKETGFGILYGMGRFTLADRLDISADDAWQLMQAYKRALPGVEKLQGICKRRGRANQPITTWGGRTIYKEPPRMVGGQLRDFGYKLLNYLIQGGSADQTKQCIIEWDKGADLIGNVFMATVHDEINVSAPEDTVQESMEWLRHCMDETGEFNVPMRSEGFMGPSWGEVGDE